MRKKLLSIILLFLLVLWGCGAQDSNSRVPVAGEEIVPSNYAKEKNWMLLEEKGQKPVDVFYLYPTSWARKDKKDYPVSTIQDKNMRKRARSVAASQARVFDMAGNLYAPYYRQVEAAFILDRDQEEQTAYYGGVPKTDAIAAFDYYIKHYNQGRPFLLVGHSQGAVMVKEILFDYMDKNPEVYKRMVAAYVIGYSVTEQELQEHPYLKFAEGPDDTGVIISYNTEAPGMTEKNPTVLPGAICINPISWTRDETPASASENAGSLIKVEGREQKLEGFADARIDKERGTVICSTVDPAVYHSSDVGHFPLGIFHRFDFRFYYYNLKENAQERVERFLEEWDGEEIPRR